MSEVDHRLCFINISHVSVRDRIRQHHNNVENVLLILVLQEINLTMANNQQPVAIQPFPMQIEYLTK